MAVFSPTELKITSKAFDVPMKKHTLLKRTQRYGISDQFETRNDTSKKFLPLQKGVEPAFKVSEEYFEHLISFIFAKHTNNIDTIPNSHILIYLWFNHVIVEQGH